MNMEDLYRILRTGHVQAQGIVDTVADPLLVLDAGLCVQNASRSYFDTFKVSRDETIGQPFYKLGDGQWDIPELRRLLADVIPKSSAVINFEVNHDFPTLGQRTMLLTARTLHHPDSGSHAMLLAIVDATESHRRDAAKDMLFGELRHRLKNMLGIAQSIARQTTTEGRTAEEYRDAFLGRFGALVESQDLAFSEQNEAGLEQLFERILEPYRDDPEAIEIEAGPSIELSPQTIMALGMVVHELATNAAKHGALSVPGGKVKASWQLSSSNRRLRVEWVESGGPVVTEPLRKGYGSQLIDFTVSHNLSGSVEQNYAPGGLEVELEFPLAKDSRATEVS
jgi:two-component sensor histidine kinase